MDVVVIAVSVEAGTEPLTMTVLEHCDNGINSMLIPRAFSQPLLKPDAMMIEE